MENKKKILIIEDEKSLRTVLHTKFEGEGFSVLAAQNGEEGLRMALQEHPDLIILDLIMPVMSGTAMLEKLRQDEWGKSVKVIVLSNMMDTGKIPVADFEKNGIIEYLVKADVKIENLVKRVKTILNN